MIRHPSDGLQGRCYKLKHQIFSSAGHHNGPWLHFVLISRVHFIVCHFYHYRYQHIQLWSWNFFSRPSPKNIKKLSQLFTPRLTPTGTSWSPRLLQPPLHPCRSSTTWKLGGWPCSVESNQQWPSRFLDTTGDANSMYSQHCMTSASLY